MQVQQSADLAHIQVLHQRQQGSWGALWVALALTKDPWERQDCLKGQSAHQAANK
jgi:hypothetical protein